MDDDYDIVRIGDHALAHGDCLHIMADIPDHSIDLILCDPPYGTTACKWDAVIPFAPMWEAYNRIAKPGAPIVLFGSQPFTSALVASNIRNFKHGWVWHKRFAANFAVAKYQPLKVHEDIVVFSNGTARYYPQKTIRDKPIKLGKNVSKSGSANLAVAKPEFAGKVYNDKNPESVLYFDTRGEGQVKAHSTQKVVGLMEYLVRTYSLPGDMILDNTMGSGSTGVAAVNLGRIFRGIEQDRHFFDIACGRIDAAFADASPTALLDGEAA